MIRKLRHCLNWPVIVAVAGAASYGWMFHVQQNQNEQVARQAAAGRQAYIALCAFTDDLAGRVTYAARDLETSQKFLHDHPHGIPGIPGQLLRQSVANKQAIFKNQTATLRSLDVLVCPKETP